MKAIAYHRHGPPDVLQYEDVEKPAPGDGEVSIRIRAASLNPYDWHFIFGSPRIVRLFSGRFPKIAGHDVAGEVEAVGSNVAELRPGDAVFGVCKGSLAEYGCTRVTALARKPENVSFEQAATLGIAGMTALQGLRDCARLQAGQRVLINGAAGGVGTFAVQIAKAFGAEVTGVCSTRNVEMVRAIGADHVVDYTRENFTRGSALYDVILDMVGSHSLSEYRRVLERKGVVAVVGMTSAGRFLRGLALAPFVPQKLALCRAKARAGDLNALGELVASGKVTPVIDRCYALPDSAEAVRYLAEGHPRGKVVVII
jgi:NADPH:quinone reductase-like Zn-dependent oxidoreductase